MFMMMIIIIIIIFKTFHTHWHIFYFIFQTPHLPTLNQEITWKQVMAHNLEYTSVGKAERALVGFAQH